MQTAAQIIECIEQRKNKGLGLDHFKSYMKTIDNPHDKLVSIHIAGTNGKGSTVNYLRAMLEEAGYRVGTFTSPYLETHFDRIRINDVNIDEASFENIANAYFESWIEYDLNMFEIDMAIACTYFLEQACDICIFEVGLGGRLDSTNILQPIACAITNIGMDHMDRLGDTYEKIAYEKAGIIKTCVPLFTTEKREACLAVFQSVCKKNDTQLIQVKDAQEIIYKQDHITFQYPPFGNITLKSAAHYQVANASLALGIIQYLQDQNICKITLEHVQASLAKTIWKGRFEVMCENPRIIIDGAHNEEGILALKQTLQNFPPVTILFAALKDKDTHQMIHHLLSISDDVYVTEFDFYRVKPANELAEYFPVHVEKDYKKVIKKALVTQTPLVITGSLYFISEIRAYLHALLHTLE